MSTTAIKRQLGQIMVDEGFLTPEQLEAAITEQHRSGKPLGQVLVETGMASAGAVANALAEQAGGLLKTEFGVSAGFRPPVPAPPTSPEPALELRAPAGPAVRTIATPEEMARRALVAELDALRDQCAALKRGVALLESELERLRDSV
jgi:hypothetical protein